MAGARAAFLILLSALSASAIAGEPLEYWIGGKSAAEVFPDAAVARMVKAACAGDTKSTAKAVRDGANVNYMGYRNTTPLLWLLGCGNYQGIEQLLQFGANPNTQDSEMPPAMWFVSGSDDPQLLQVLLRHGGDPNIGYRQETPLLVAVMHERDANVKLLLDSGADINHVDSVGKSAAVLAARLNRFDLVAYMLNKGYKHDLTFLARNVEIAVVPLGSPAALGRQQVLEMLKERGVVFPLPPVVPPPPPDVDKLRGRSEE